MQGWVYSSQIQNAVRVVKADALQIKVKVCGVERRPGTRGMLS